MNDENMTITIIKAFRTTLGERNKDDPDQATAPDLEHTNQDTPLKRAPLPDRSFLMNHTVPQSTSWCSDSMAVRCWTSNFSAVFRRILCTMHSATCH